MDMIIGFKAFVPLFQSLLWILFIIFVVWKFRVPLTNILAAIHKRVEAGSEMVLPGGFVIRGAPAGVKTSDPVGVTNEGVGGLTTPDEVNRRLTDKEYPSGIVEEIYLVHQAAVILAPAPERPGIFRVHVWVEVYEDSLMGEILRVSYRLYNNEFPKPVITTESREKKYELWLNVYGEFTLVALVERANKPHVWLTRYLDLPGRPAD